ncbi:MAG: SAM-dependent methyltransferase [Rubrivivax sp.]|jgi:16S rRNA (cytidine1402-2'-O)-methyltransferase
MSHLRSGRLVLVPNTLDLGAEAVPIEAALPAMAIARAAALTHWVAEDARSTRVFLKRVGAVVPLVRPLQEVTITELPRPRKGSGQAVAASEWDRLLAPALAGVELGLLSEAGLPAVADPGAELVASAHRAGVAVEVLAGPSALVLAVAASGLGGQNFAFVGYLPQDAVTRATRIRQLEAQSRQQSQAQLFIETPYRNAALWDALLAGLNPSTRLAVACGLTLPGGFNLSDTVAGWRGRPAIDWPDKLPAVFVLKA